MKKLTFEQAMCRIGRGEPVTLYKPIRQVASLQLCIIQDMVEKGAFFAIEGEDEEKTFPTVHDPKADRHSSDVAKKHVVAKKTIANTPMEKRKRDYARMQALRNAGRSVEWIADDCGVSVATVYAHTTKPDV